MSWIELEDKLEANERQQSVVRGQLKTASGKLRHDLNNLLARLEAEQGRLELRLESIEDGVNYV